MDQNALASQFQQAAKILNLHPPPCLYQLRHSGASRDFQAGHRTLKEIKRRGRWKTDSSVRRYEKGGRITDQLQKLPVPLQNFCKTVFQKGPDIICSKVDVPPFPVL
eukprot:9507587-Karenia_brevis.AAC.1